MNPEPRVACPACGEIAPAGANWCEACGTDLGDFGEVADQDARSAACIDCGVTSIDDDGYCTDCGRKQPAPRDHVVMVDGRAALVSDRGRRHHENEDAGSIRVLDDGGVARAILVVCDGVSSTPGSAAVSEAAAVAAASVALPPVGATEGQTREALRAADDAAVRTARTAGGDVAGASSASSTVVVAVVESRSKDTRVSVSWRGDSRAYWVSASGDTMQLSEDHEIEGSLTRWIGADAPAGEPDITIADLDGPGTVVVCTDGLWRYASDVADFGNLVRSCSVAEDGSAVTSVEHAEALVAFANEAGGHDNITVALLPVGEGGPD